jgi:toxin ParE1/3/4
LRVRWTRPALADFIEAQEYIARENPQAAQQLADNPDSGRAGHIAGTREWVINGTPYLIVYRIQPPEIEILRLWHGRRNWRAP